MCGVIESENLDPNGHDWEDDYTVDVPATYTIDGSESIHCMDCEAVKDSIVILATDHSYRDWQSLRNLSVLRRGQRKRYVPLAVIKSLRRSLLWNMHGMRNLL